MDGRRSLFLAGGLLGGMLGCATPQTAPPAPQAAQPADQQAAKAPSQSISGIFSRSKAPQSAQPAPAAQAAAGSRTTLKPETYVSIGALKDQAADDPGRPQAERDGFRTQARQAYQKAIDLDPKNSAAYAALAASYVATDERDKALATYKKGLTVAPNDTALWYELGMTLARFKDWPAAADSLAKATKLDPANVQYQKQFGFTLARAGRYDDALAALSKCMPEAEARTNIARMQMHNQQPQAAQQQAQLALRANPTYMPAHELLASMNGPTINSTIRPVRYEEPAQVPAQVQAQARPMPAQVQAQARPMPAAAPRLPPVTLQGKDNMSPLAPVRVGIDGIE